MRRRAQIDPAFDAPAFTAAYAVMGAQRATKILGLFTRLDRRDGKPQYLRLLPRIEQTLAKNLAHPVLESAATLVRNPSAARARPAAGRILSYGGDAEDRDGVRRRARRSACGR